MSQPFDEPNVERAFSAFPDEVKTGLLLLRALIFDVAARTEGVGRLEETLKWGQPAYLTPETKPGTTIRLGCPKAGGFAITCIVKPASCRTIARFLQMTLLTKATVQSTLLQRGIYRPKSSNVSSQAR